MKLNIIVGLCFVMASSWLHSAQDKTSCGISVVSFGKIQSGQRDLYCVDSTSSEKIKVRASSTTVAPPIEYVGDRKFSLCRKVGEEYTPLANVNLPDGVSRVIIILAPSRSKKRPYMATVVNGSLKKFPGSKL